MVNNSGTEMGVKLSRTNSQSKSSIYRKAKSLNKSCFESRVSAAKSSESTYFHQFLEIQCSYLCPNDLDESFLAKENSEFVIFTIM